MSVTDEIRAATRAVALRDVEPTTTMRPSTTPTSACRGVLNPAEDVRRNSTRSPRAF